MLRETEVSRSTLSTVCEGLLDSPFVISWQLKLVTGVNDIIRVKYIYFI